MRLEKTMVTSVLASALAMTRGGTPALSQATDSGGKTPSKSPVGVADHRLRGEQLNRPPVVGAGDPVVGYSELPQRTHHG